MKLTPEAEEPQTETQKREISQLVAKLTHELKTPLHSMLAVAEILASEVDGPLNDEQRRQVAMIKRNGEDLLELITGLLSYSSLESNSHRINVDKLELESLLRSIVESVEGLAGRSNVRIESELEDISGDFFSDKGLLKRIIGNLLGNAIKFSPDGGTVWFFARRTPDGGLSIQIADSGIGMPPEVQKAIFTEFYQVDAGDARRFGGVGLGLALVKASLSLLGGTIDVKSEKDRGSLFTITIPTAVAEYSQKKLLIVEQDQSVQLSLTESFRTLNYDSIILADPKNLVSEIADLKPDLLILAIEPPGDDSFSLLEQVRKSPCGEELPVILMSTLDGPQERSRGFELGANDFIVKPFNVAELLARVKTQLQRL